MGDETFFALVACDFTDCYKRAEACGYVVGIYDDEEPAYARAVELVYEDDHNADSKVLLDLQPRETWKKTFKQISKDWEAIYGKPYYTIQPSGTVYTVEEHKIQYREEPPIKETLQRLRNEYSKWLAENDSKLLDTPLKKWLTSGQGSSSAQ